MKSKRLLILAFILAAALFLRVYRVDALMGFYFDQGRDARVIWDLWHSHRFFLIGPTTGIEGIFLGPFFYYLIAPFYLIGNGNPVFPAVFLALLNVAGIYFIFKIGKDYFSDTAGLLGALFVSLSLPLTQAHRWLSNPTPLPFFSAVCVYLLLKIVFGSKKPFFWLVFGLFAGLSLQLEAASAVFFIPATLLIFILTRISIKGNIANFIHLLFAFSLTLLPQLWFNLRHDNILLLAFKKFLVTDKSFAPKFSEFVVSRLNFYFGAFSQKLFLDHSIAISMFTLIVVMLVVGLITRRLFTRQFLVLSVWCLTPLTFLLFYHGNNGYVWDYYFTGIYSLFALMVAIVLSSFASVRLPFAKGVVGLIIVVFVVTNLSHQRNYLSAGLNGETNIVLGNSLAAVDWIYKDAGPSGVFNVDVYVPPVIPHSYDYLLLWRGSTKYQVLPQTSRVPTLYLIYEADPPYPDRLQTWMNRQNTYAAPGNPVRFGGVTVEKRTRYEANQ